jgi:serine/threonine-protein kinase
MDDSRLIQVCAPPSAAARRLVSCEAWRLGAPERNGMTSSRAASVSAQGLPRPGDVVLGKYRIERSIGRGGMGIVLAASHLSLRERVALKVLLPSLIENQEVVARFLREAQAAVRIKSEHVARVMDAGRLESGVPFLVMELLEGKDLGRHVREEGRLPVATAVEYVLQALEAIAEAHSLGIVHRDLKPGNLFVTTRADGSPLVKVLDFGISKMAAEAHAEDGEQSLTTGDDVLGSPMYMSPEQIRTPKAVDGRADLWAIGAILHRLITGKPVFAAEAPGAILAAIIGDPPRVLRDDLPEAPAELEAVVRWCLEKDVARRVQTAQELAQALLPFAPEASRAWRRATGVLKAPTGVTPAPLSTSRADLPPPPAALTGHAWAAPPAPPSRGKLLAIIAGAAALTVSIGLGAASSMGPRYGAPTLERARTGVAVASVIAASRTRRARAEAPRAAPPPVPSSAAAPSASAPPRPSAAVGARPRAPAQAPSRPSLDPLDDRE